MSDLTDRVLSGVKQELDCKIYDRYGGTVQGGPFKGMRLLKEVHWNGSRLAPMVLGCHEEELHGEIDAVMRMLQPLENPRIAVVGCAEGYYAIGLKLRVPKATVFAVEADEKTQMLCKSAAKLNGVDLIFDADVKDYLRSDFIFMDVEGHEVAYLDPDRFPFLANAHIIVELHDYRDSKPNATQLTLQRFSGSHRINLIMEGPRNPNMYDCMFNLHSDYRWLAVSEGRPCLMSWLVMIPRGVNLV